MATLTWVVFTLTVIILIYHLYLGMLPRWRNSPASQTAIDIFQ